jgi:hypothetical protein
MMIVPTESTARLAEQTDLQWIAGTYEQTQRMRVQTGERLRAMLQGRHNGAFVSPPPEDAATVLEQIRRGETTGPSHYLGRVYRLTATAEGEAQRAMRDVLEAHPTWPWLSGVKGVGATLACRLLARLDPVRATTPSAFWAYCGLATVPGREYACPTCGRRITQPVGFKVSGIHKRLRGSGRCTGQLQAGRGPDEGVRAAQPRPGRGERASYNPQAKTVCYLICVSFLRCGGAYSDWYRETRAELEATRPGWAKGRIHLTAVRKTQKLFLAHLWVVWREALDLSVTSPNPAAADAPWIDPWSMRSTATTRNS